MRSIAVIFVLLFAGAIAALAQDTPGGDLGLTYQWVRTNATPGVCGCFSLNGGGLSGSWNVHAKLALLGEFSVLHAGNALGTGGSLTLTSGFAGLRYRIHRPWPRESHAPEPFLQLLVGAEHAGGSVAGRGDGDFAFASRVGGGIDVPLTSHLAVRAIQIDYFFTRSANAVNDRQNNLLVAAGFVFRWARR